MEDSKKNYLKKAMLLHAVADYSLVKKGDSLYNQCAQAIEGGITLLQLKAQELSDEDFIKEGLKIKKL
ncbi:MAG: thiamine phosphate synthase, partial [Sphaerochaetaceae bacterium]|nr:thiamine phosphate synthase [Sphaerochaetaceae bacterium]